MVTLEQIYASKIFQSSTRKNRILSAFNTSAMSPVLTIQSPASVEPKYKKNTIREEALPQGDDNADDANESIRPSSSSGSHGGGGSFSSAPSDLPSLDDLAGMDDVPEEALSDDSSSDSESEPAADIQEPVEEATGIDIELNLNELKDKLNSNDNTSGVARIKTKNNELWIYYTDEINLNSIMVDAIESVQSFDSDAEFNRLARSENAMVFQIPEGKANEGNEA